MNFTYKLKGWTLQKLRSVKSRNFQFITKINNLDGPYCKHCNTLSRGFGSSTFALYFDNHKINVLCCNVHPLILKKSDYLFWNTPLPLQFLKHYPKKKINGDLALHHHEIARIIWLKNCARYSKLDPNCEKM